MPTLPPGTAAVVMANDEMATVSALLAVLPPSSVTLTVTLNVPPAVGFPLTTPSVDNDTPGGSAPDWIDQVAVPNTLAAVRAVLGYGLEIVPAGSIVVVTASA